MKNKTLTLADFEKEAVTKKQQKAIRGGDDYPTEPINEPKNGGGGNGSA
ncbi:rSAM-modified peptide [Flavobacterium anhuiense]|nr:rSAM-modified peptide [Flavobacterium anhuiense]URM38106.1 rSAM-modified peptide [Flavobacterium anhuiense]